MNRSLDFIAFLFFLIASTLSAAAGGSYTLSVGQSQTLSFTPRDGGKGFVWTSTDPAAVEITAQSGTTATVTARHGSAHPVTVSCAYTVTVQGNGFSFEDPVSEDFYISVPLDVTGIEIPESLELYKGTSYAFSPRVLPAGAITSISWTSSNPAVATIDDSGVLRAIAEGSTDITAHAASGHTAVCRVNVIRPTVQLQCSVNYSIVLPGTEVTLTAMPADATIRYTLDGTEPTATSTLYTAPIVIDRDLTLKAVATRKECLDSPVLVREYRLSDLAVQSTYPVIGAELIRSGIIPAVTYSADICPGAAFDEIELLDRHGGIVDGRAGISGPMLFFIPDEELGLSHYSLNIPAHAVNSYSGDWIDDFSLAFSVKGAAVCKDFVPVSDMAAELLKTDGTLWTWGYERYLGDGSSGRSYTATPRKIMDNVESISYMSAVKADGTLWTWGEYTGDGTREERFTPVKIMDDVISVHRNLYWNLALKDDNTLWKWTSNILTPEKILNDIKSVFISDRYAFAIDINNTLLWWSRNTTYPDKPETALEYVRSVSHYDGTVFAVKNDNTLWTWGKGEHNILGDGTTSDRTVPVMIMDNISLACVGDDQGYAIGTDNTLWGWGWTSYGGIGDGTKDTHPTPVMVCKDVKSIHASFQSRHIIKTDGTLWGWGGIVGDGTREIYLSPVKIADNVTQMYSTHIDAFYFVKDDGSLWGYGDDTNNIIGAGLKGLKESPVLCVGTDAVEPTSFSLADAIAGIGSSRPVTPHILPTDASYRTIEWSISDESVATVDSRGVVTGVADGETTLTATLTGYTGQQLSATCRVHVYENAGIADVKTEGRPATVDVDGLTLRTDAPAHILSLSGIELHRSASAPTQWTAPGTGVYIVLTADGHSRKVLLR